MHNATHVRAETEKQKEQRKKKRSYLDNLPEFNGKNFLLPNDQIDGLLPSAKVSDWKRLLEILQGDDFKKTKNELVYRGQRGHDWQLASTLGRVFEGGNIPQDKQDRLLKEFRLSMRGRGHDLTTLQSDNEVWAVGQHFGLRTPLLDWTRSPFVALFFAFSKYETIAQVDNNPSRAIFCLNKSALEEDLGIEITEQIFLEPEDHQNARLVNQSGLFTVTPSGADDLVSYLIHELDNAELLGSVDETVVEAPENQNRAIFEQLFNVVDDNRAKLLGRYLFKLHIPNSVDGRKDCLEALRQMNIHHGNLFPDPSGASEFCNDWLERLLEDEEQETKAENDAKVRRERTERLNRVSGEDILDRIKQILREAFRIDESALAEFAPQLKTKADEATSLDWHKSLPKRTLVKRAITRAIASSGFSIQDGQEVGKLIAMILDEFVKEAKTSND